MPNISRLMMSTGQSSRRNVGKRAIDTEILLRESSLNIRGSERYAIAVARINYL